jgi:hypothetical protein
MDGIKALLNSEKGLICVALIIGSTVLTAVGKLTVEQWQTYTTWIFGTYVVGKTVQGVAAAKYAVDPEPTMADKLVTAIAPHLAANLKPDASSSDVIAGTKSTPEPVQPKVTL